MHVSSMYLHAVPAAQLVLGAFALLLARLAGDPVAVDALRARILVVGRHQPGALDGLVALGTLPGGVALAQLVVAEPLAAAPRLVLACIADAVLQLHERAEEAAYALLQPVWVALYHALERDDEETIKVGSILVKHVLVP